MRAFHRRASVCIRDGDRGNTKSKFVRLFVAAVVAWTSVPIDARAQPVGQQRDNPPRSPALTDPLLASRTRWDINHDGVNTCEEWQIFVSRLFDLANQNEDRSLNTKEFVRLREKERLFADADFSFFDVDHNGRISRKEFIGRPNPFFVRFDRNGDCRVTAEETAANGNSAPRGRPQPPGGGSGRGARGEAFGFRP